MAGETFKAQLEGSGDREISTTMSFVRILAALLRDKEVGPRVVPIVPDESRTFGMEGMFRQLGIFSASSQGSGSGRLSCERCSIIARPGVSRLITVASAVSAG